MPAPPPWHAIALEELAASVAEQASGDHPRILEYLGTCSDLEEGEWDRDSTPWCSAFVNWCLARCGIEGTDSGWARSWADWGRPIDGPRLGAIAVWARGRNSADEPIVTGHVAFVVEDRGDSLLVLGGNQSDRVCLKTYPKRGYLTDTVDSSTPVRELYELIGYRWPDESGIAGPQDAAGDGNASNSNSNGLGAARGGGSSRGRGRSGSVGGSDSGGI